MHLDCQAVQWSKGFQKGPSDQSFTTYRRMVLHEDGLEWFPDKRNRRDLSIFPADNLFAPNDRLPKKLTLRWCLALDRFRAIRIVVLHLIHTTTHRIRAHLECIIRLQHFQGVRCILQARIEP